MFPLELQNRWLPISRNAHIPEPKRWRYYLLPLFIGNNREIYSSPHLPSLLFFPFLYKQQEWEQKDGRNEWMNVGWNVSISTLPLVRWLVCHSFPFPVYPIPREQQFWTWNSNYRIPNVPLIFLWFDYYSINSVFSTDRLIIDSKGNQIDKNH